MSVCVWRSAVVVVAGLLAAAPAAAEDKPVPPSEAAARMTLPPGFRATLFAGEPDVVQPIAMTLDGRGRLWVVESYSYPNWIRSGAGKDRILIFEDADGDGRFDKRTVFYDKGANFSGLAVGFGGVWVCASPNLLFIPDRDGDDVPDGPPEVVLNGWSLDAKHNVFNSLTWGPDGWLYGCNGILATSQVGPPGARPEKRTPMNCGVWRYHPTKSTFEVVVHGTTNPWGLDFDDLGQAFITNCVIEHLWHVVPGAHFKRMYGQDFDPHLYRLMETCADHIHWAGGHWTESRGGKGTHDAPGGGHAHAGCMVYLGDNFPASYRDGVFTCNIHGNRVNHDTLARKGSGYVARHATDFLLANDPMSRGLAMQYGPDGGVFLSDWYDTGECHNYEQVHISGRVYKITFGKTTPYREDVSRLSDDELVRRQLHKNDWHVRQARRVLQERAAAGRLSAGVKPALLKMLRENDDVTRRLRALWALHVVGGLDEVLLLEQMGSPHETVRAWAVRLSVEYRQPSAAVLARLEALAAKDPSPFVRLHLASGMQRIPLGKRWGVAEALAARGEDATDINLALMVWYGVEPLYAAKWERFLSLIPNAKIPLVREHAARRVTEAGPQAAVRLLGETGDDAVRADVLRGVLDALAGRRDVPMPEEWRNASRALATSPSADVRERAALLAVTFGDAEAIAALRMTAADASGSVAARETALQALLTRKNPDLVPLLHELLSDKAVRGPALRGLAAFADADTPRLVLNHYAAFTEAEKADAVHTLSARPAYALALLDAVDKGRVPRRDVSAFTVRQMQALKDRHVNERAAKVWGVLRPASQEKAELTRKYKALLSPEYLKGADAARGRVVYGRTCASCHVLFGEGGKVGPELTGSQRANLDYVLENVLDPSAVVPKDYQVTLLTLTDGRVVSGIVKEDGERVVTVQTPNEVLRLPVRDIEARATSPVSLMPEGLLANLKADEVRDLVAYLASPAQVPLPRQK